MNFLKNKVVFPSKDIVIFKVVFSDNYENKSKKVKYFISSHFFRQSLKKLTLMKTMYIGECHSILNQSLNSLNVHIVSNLQSIQHVISFSQ